MKRSDPVRRVIKESSALMFTGNSVLNRQDKNVKLTNILDRIERLKGRTSIDVSGQDLRAESLPPVVEKINSLPQVKELLVRDQGEGAGTGRVGTGRVSSLKLTI